MEDYSSTPIHTNWLNPSGFVTDVGGSAGSPADCGVCLDREGTLKSKGNVSQITPLIIARVYVKEGSFDWFKEQTG